jgi:hypothetical protein
LPVASPRSASLPGRSSMITVRSFGIEASV